ncbi:type IV secretory system conjugative DNA transfer family protein [Vibrio vulnificus]|nr:type IV secretory system conjugative DNA transfer family protein [Vibrio vulnificus]
MNAANRIMLTVFIGMVSLTVNGKQADTETRKLAELQSANFDYVETLAEKQQFYNELIRTAKEVGFRHAYKKTIDDEIQKLKANNGTLDDLLSFKRVTSAVQDGAARGMFLVAGVVDKLDASTERMSGEIIATNSGSFLMRQRPYVAVTPPNWRDYLYLKQDIEISPPPPSKLPRNQKEEAIWEKNVEIGWNRGIKAAQDEMHRRWLNLFADLRGMVRYWTLVEMGQINDVQVVVAHNNLLHQATSDNEELIFNPTVVQIQSQATFNPKTSDWHLVSTQPNIESRKKVRDAVIDGTLLIDDIANKQIVILTPDDQRQMDAISNENIFK